MKRNRPEYYWIAVIANIWVVGCTDGYCLSDLNDPHSLGEFQRERITMSFRYAVEITSEERTMYSPSQATVKKGQARLNQAFINSWQLPWALEEQYSYHNGQDIVPCLIQRRVRPVDSLHMEFESAPFSFDGTASIPVQGTLTWRELSAGRGDISLFLLDAPYWIPTGARSQPGIQYLFESMSVPSRLRDVGICDDAEYHYAEPPIKYDGSEVLKAEPVTVPVNERFLAACNSNLSQNP